ncbi:MAG TPA: phosphotransferase [Vicinamibacteria bacterium]|nr:phosphotransferase [Vicinamibacteria bacterium]
MRQPVTRDATSAALRGFVEEALARHFGASRTIVHFERKASSYQTSFVTEELGVRLDDGREVSLLFKDLGRQGLLAPARGVKPQFLLNPLRELETYRGILSRARLGTPVCYGAVADSERERYWLFLERVRGLELYQLGELHVWEEVARWLARMHGLFAGEIDLLRHRAPLLEYGREYYWTWIRRAKEFVRGSLARKEVHGIDWLADCYDRLVDSLVELPHTLVHGDFNASNVLVQTQSQETRVCPVDWEMAAIGPGLVDLASLISGQWSEAQRNTLVQAYRVALRPNEGWPSSEPALLDALDRCRLHLAVQWLGWAREWSPPAEHAQDWLGEALRLAETLAL